MKRRMVSAIQMAVLLLPGLAAGEGTLTLVSDGKANCVIVAGTDAKRGKGPEGESPLSENIRDFQRILEKMSGAGIPIVGPEQATGDVVRICVGNVPLPEGLNVDESTIGPRGYGITATGKALVLRGKTEGGTINALYGFLQDKLGVRWFFPTELFEVIPARKTIAIPFCREIHNPSFEYGMFDVNSGLSDAGQRWGERMRRDAGAYRLRADPHYIGYILNSDLYGKTHPEYYPLLNGARAIPPPGDRSAPQPCFSNPDLAKAVVEFCRRSFDENPNALSVAIGENDSIDWCECDRCRALDASPREAVNDIVQHSDRYFTFANQVAREIAASHPGKLIGCLVYNGTYTPPRNIAQLEPNLAIAVCVDNSQYYDRSYRDRDYRVLEGWRRKGIRHIVLYDYLGLCWWWAPRYFPHQHAAHMKEMYAQGLAGWYGGFPGHWATQGPMFYLTARLMWDANLDPDDELDDFFRQAFGPKAGREMKAFYRALEKAWQRPAPGRNGKYFEGWSSMREQMVPYRLSDLDKALTHLARARALAGDGMARRRADYIADHFGYAANAMRGWLSSDAIDRLGGEAITSPQKAGAVSALLLTVAGALKDEEPIYRKTLLADPISDREGKSGRADHFGIIRGQWEPRCRYSLVNGTAALLGYYRRNNMTGEPVALRNELPPEVYQAAQETIDDVSVREVRPEKRMECRRVDASFPDWAAPTFVLDSVDRVGSYGGVMTDKWRGPDTFSASACLGWDDEGLHLAVKVKDADHDQRHRGDAIWQGDSIQFGIDAAADGNKRPFGSGYDDANDSLYGLALGDRPGSAPELYRWTAPRAKSAGSIPDDGTSHRYGVRVENGIALYRVFVSWRELGTTPRIGDRIGFNLVVFDAYRNEQDRSDVLMWLELTPGIAGSAGQSPALWHRFVVRAAR